MENQGLGEAAEIAPQRQRSPYKWVVIYSDANEALKVQECVSKQSAEEFVNQLDPQTATAQTVYQVVKTITPRSVFKL